jgi:hypothetical protein
MYALRVRGNVGLVFVCAAAALAVACGSNDTGRGNSGQNVQAGYANAAGFGGYPFASGGFSAGGWGGAASGGAVIVGQGGIIASGGALMAGAPPVGTGGVIDPGPKPTGQMLDCQGTGPCRLDDGDACCIAASVNNGVVTSMSVNCIPPSASCDYPFTIAYCDGPEDCRQSEACCGTLKPFGTAQLFGEVACVPAGECTGAQKFIVCRAGITQCPGGTSCGPFPTLPSDMNVCR